MLPILLAIVSLIVQAPQQNPKPVPTDAGERRRAVAAMTDTNELAKIARTDTDGTVRRAAAERFLAERARTCGGPASDLGAWPPPDKNVRLTVDFFFAQPVDDDLRREQTGNATAMSLGGLMPLGLAVDVPADAVRPTLDETRAARPEAEGVRPATEASVEVTALGEALMPEHPAPEPRYTGAAWSGAISVLSKDRCLYSAPFEGRVWAPDFLVESAPDSPSDAPYLEALEFALRDAILRTAYALRGEVGLSRIAMSEADWQLRIGAVQRIAGQEALTGLARGAKAPWLRAAATEKLTDQTKLVAIATSDREAEVRTAAVSRLTDSTALARIAATDKDEGVRKAATTRLGQLGARE